MKDLTLVKMQNYVSGNLKCKLGVVYSYEDDVAEELLERTIDGLPVFKEVVAIAAKEHVSKDNDPLHGPEITDDEEPESTEEVQTGPAVDVVQTVIVDPVTSEATIEDVAPAVLETMEQPPQDD